MQPITVFANWQAAIHQATNPWTKLPKKYVNNDGLVNYKGFIKDIKELDAYLLRLLTILPGDTWSKNEQLAYWFNAYNAFTVKLITMHYPISGIKKIGPDIHR